MTLKAGVEKRGFLYISNTEAIISEIESTGIYKLTKFVKVALLLLFTIELSAFNIYNFGEGRDRLLIVGGIHGDEQGSYLAPALFVKHYQITKGAVTVIPNLNRDSYSIHKRGKHGDMNRKFAEIDPDDRDYKTVKRIQKAILHRDTAVVLNLHDGSGYFKKYPKSWGQSIVIDQESIDTPFGDLKDIGERVVKRVNSWALDIGQEFGVKNTHTRLGNREMMKTLTYFAIQNGKSAFGVEASKNLKEDWKRVYYHLQVFEAFMSEMGIEFKRNFKLNKRSLERILSNFGTLKVNDSIELPLSNIKESLKYFPLKSGKNSFEFSHPLGKAIYSRGEFQIYVGYRKVLTLKPQYFKHRTDLSRVKIAVDEVSREIYIGSTVDFKDSFKTLLPDNYRVNIIGFSKSGKKDENLLKVQAKDLDSRFSIDKSATIYRAEIYRDHIYCGTVLFRRID
jgi:hypothetical protein